ncbi:hypothetical protein ACMHYB_25575 [Sorangium sp. So ce1128]
MKSLHAATLVLFCSLFAVSCILDAEPTSTDDPTGEVQQPFPLVYFTKSDFPFVTTVKDDGKDEGGGWQVAKANLKFAKLRNLRPVRSWTCSLNVEMPLRTKQMGRISSNRAARLSAEISDGVARRMDYNLPRGIFCKRFVQGMREMFISKHPKLGARVTE